MRFAAALWARICVGLLVWVACAPAFAAIRLPLLSPPAQVSERKLALGDWRLRIETSRFSGDTRCRLEDRKHHVSYVASQPAGRTICPN